MKLILFVGCLALSLAGVHSRFWSNPYPKHNEQPILRSGPQVRASEPLFLTPYIQSGDLETARSLSTVGPIEGVTLTSYSGYITVNSIYNSNLFFWFFPAQVRPLTAPVLLWLQGGPGTSSMYAVFEEHGPYSLDPQLTLHPRVYSWTTEFSVIYVDNPVGTGFSFTDNEAGYARSEDDVTRDLYEFLRQFFTLFSTYRINDFYVAGESYAGKFVPALANKIHSENPAAAEKINLNGVSIGDGLIDPINMLSYSDFLYTIGLVDEKQRDYFRTQEQIAAAFINQGQYESAFDVIDYTINGGIYPYPTFFENSTGFTHYYHYLWPVVPPGANYANFYIDLLNLAAIQDSLHTVVGPFSPTNVDVEKYLVNDIMQSARPNLQFLLDNDYRVLLYNGQYDVIVAHPLIANAVENLTWKFSNEFYDAEKIIWKLNPSTDVDIAGYVKQDHNLYFITVLNAGHFVPSDQPKVAYNMITNFVFGRSFG